MGIKTDIAKLHYDKSPKGILFNVLKFCSVFYMAGSELKNFFYDKKIIKPKKVDAFVVSVGNFTTGGVGKTPLVAQIANYYIAAGEKVAIISRGYGSQLSKKVKVKTCCAPILPISEGINLISDGEKIFYDARMAGDEPHWLAENTKAVIVTAKNRYEGAKFAIDKFGATKIILDDGFQHRKLYRDIDIVLVDSEMGFGNENLLPAGPLREKPNFDRVDKLVVVSKNLEHTRAEKYAKIMSKKLKKETFVCYTEPDEIYNLFNPNENLSTEEKVIAFSAIGQPQQFYKFLKGYEILQTVDFDDHHDYQQKDIDELSQKCLNLGAKNMITTEKDAGKLHNFKFSDVNIYALKLKTVLDLDKLLK